MSGGFNFGTAGAKVEADHAGVHRMSASFYGGRNSDFRALIYIVRAYSQFAMYEFGYIKSVSFIIVREFFILRMSGDIIFCAEKRPDALHLQNTIAVIHNSYFIN